MKEILFSSLIACLQMLFSPMISAQIKANVLENNDIEEIECTQTSAKERLTYDIEELNTALFEQGTIKRDREGLLSVEKVKQQLVAQNNILVDIRSAEQFSAYRIAKSININATQISNKAFLKDKSVVLINEGFSVVPMNDLYKDLLAAGFNQVNILGGGLNAWKQAGEKLDGAGQFIKKSNWVTPQQFFLERKHQDLIVLDIPEQKWQYSKSEIEKKLQKQLTKKMEQKKRKEKRLLIVNEHGKGYENIQQAVTGLEWQNVFFLQGGKKAYQTYLASLQAMWNRPTEKQGKVNTCGRRK